MSKNALQAINTNIGRVAKFHQGQLKGYGPHMGEVVNWYSFLSLFDFPRAYEHPKARTRPLHYMNHRTWILMQGGAFSGSHRHAVSPGGVAPKTQKKPHFGTGIRISSLNIFP